MTRDGGATATKPLSIPNTFTSFARMPDGALIVSGMAFLGQGLGTVPALCVSHDDGATFQENHAVPDVLALAQRDGILYAAADNFADGFALGASSDEGATWQPVVRFDQIRSIMACLRTNAQCQASCEALAGKGLGVAWDDLGRGGLHRADRRRRERRRRRRRHDRQRGRGRARLIRVHLRAGARLASADLGTAAVLTASIAIVMLRRRRVTRAGDRS